MKECLLEFGLVFKPNYLVSDSTNNMKASARVAKMSNVRCAAHLINLIIEKALNNQSIKIAIEEFKKIGDIF